MRDSQKLQYEARKKAQLMIYGPLSSALVVAFCCYQWGGIRTFDILLFLASCFLTTFSVTAGYHRLFSHRSYKPARWLKILLGILTATSGQGPIMFWVSVHRQHHLHTDEVGDPHSPHAGTRADEKGSLFAAHVGWMLSGGEKVNLGRVRDLATDPDILFIDRHHWVWFGLGLVIPAMLGWWYWMQPIGILQGLLFGGLLRISAAQNLTWAVNSIGHSYGYRTYPTNDRSQNNVLLGFLMLGDGFHNNHHFKPASPRHGLRWWELDITYVLLTILQRLGVIKEMKQIPTYPRAFSFKE